ncbi:MAG: hypothetical protein ABIF85_04825 [Nanoarchaeota archaeon]|nr:hypothetical protein [Nanoarchaeota archaeon]MBU4451658.1 hypothetical protein [Nanoarchaeota archaeon]MCG2724573.1 hypothetical protein [archaeon]
MKSKILFVFLFLAVFHFSSDNVTADDCFPLCTQDDCDSGYTYITDCCSSDLCKNLIGYCSDCENDIKCEANSIAEYKAPDLCILRLYLLQQAQCKKTTPCTSPTPRCYDDGATVTCVECLTNADCTSPDTCDIGTHKCKTPPPIGCDQDGDTIIDTAVDACCVKFPGTKCQLSGTYQCLSDPSCSICSDDDNGINVYYKATCRDTANGVCDAASGGCTDTCASSGSVNEFYCSGSAIQTCASETIACSSSEFCYNGVCTTGPSDPYTPAPTPVGCTWWSTTFNICSSGCPPSYANQQFVCCETAPIGCRNAPQCTSHNPQIGETPCCTAGGYYTCTAQEICTETGCENVCTTADKNSALYCDKCDYCQDGIQNCGEPSTDVCGEPCQILYTGTCYTQPSYGKDDCGPIGVNKCQYYCGTSICLGLVSCSYEEYGCIYSCQTTGLGFNPASCTDGLQNCAETCVDGGLQCNAGTKETDNSYQIIYNFIEPPELTNTKLYVDQLSFNCMDGKDNDHDCLIDCDDPDCATALGCNCTNIEACADQEPPVTTITFNPPAPNAKGWYLTNVIATLTCVDPEPSSGCSPKYKLDNGTWTNYYLPFLIVGNGIHTIEYYSEDGAGNIELVKTAVLKIYTSQPFAILANDQKIVVLLGEEGQATANIKNLQSTSDIMEFSVFGLPPKIDYWIWFTGKKETNRQKTSISLLPGEEKVVSINVFGGEVLSGGRINLTAESSDKGVAKSVIFDVSIVYSEDGLTAQTPEFGWLGFASIALLGALMLL